MWVQPHWLVDPRNTIIRVEFAEVVTVAEEPAVIITRNCIEVA